MPVAPRQVGYGEAAPSLIGRDVEVETRAAYYDTAPACAFAFLPTGAFGGQARRQQVAEALAAHFGPRLGSVVPAQQVRLAERALALDATRAEHRGHLGRHLRCPAVLHAEPFGSGDLYAGVWTQARVGLALELRQADGGQLLWRARHIATRNAGGLPLSPLGAAGEAVAAAAFQADPEVPASLLHDAVRRLAAALPPVPGRGARGAHTQSPSFAYPVKLRATHSPSSFSGAVK